MTAIITTADKLKCAEREASMRRRVYPRWVVQGKMRQGDADRETAIMEAIAADYRKQVEGERLL